MRKAGKGFLSSAHITLRPLSVQKSTHVPVRRITTNASAFFLFSHSGSTATTPADVVTVAGACPTMCSYSTTKDILKSIGYTEVYEVY